MDWSDAKVVRLGDAVSASWVHAQLADVGDGHVPLLYRPEPSPDSPRAAARLLDELAKVAVDLYPAWPPGGATLEEDGGASGLAVENLARELANRNASFAPFWIHSVREARMGRTMRGRFTAEVEARGIPELLKLAWQRPGLVLLVEPFEAEPPAHEALATALAWMAFHGRIAVAIGPSSPGPYHRFPVFDLVEHPDRDEPDTAGARGGVEAPAPPGRPHPASDVEKLIYDALQGKPWAEDARFTQTLTIGAFGQKVIVDLLFTEAKVIVEFDGNEHRGRQKYARDRRRDSELTVQGYTVHRFTNDEIRADAHDVLARMERYVATARTSIVPGRKGATEGLHPA